MKRLASTIVFLLIFSILPPRTYAQTDTPTPSPAEVTPEAISLAYEPVVLGGIAGITEGDIEAIAHFPRVGECAGCGPDYRAFFIPIIQENFDELPLAERFPASLSQITS